MKKTPTLREKLKKRDFYKDSELEIRNMNEINSLPVKQLTDLEIIKLFFSRFQASALVMIYFDKEGIHISSRVNKPSKNMEKLEQLQNLSFALSDFVKYYENSSHVEIDSEQ